MMQSSDRIVPYGRLYGQVKQGNRVLEVMGNADEIEGAEALSLGAAS